MRVVKTKALISFADLRHLFSPRQIACFPMWWLNKYLTAVSCVGSSPLWPHMRQAKFSLWVSQVFFFFSRGSPVFAHLLIGPSHMS